MTLWVATGAFAQLSDEVIRIWPDGVPGGRADGGAEVWEGDRVRNIHDPSLTVYRAAPAANSGTAVVVCPGGGYAREAFGHEGWEVGLWLQSRGVTAFVLRYRLGDYGHPHPLRDVLQAIRVVRSRAADYGVRPDRIGVLGFSAGGHLASTAATLFDHPDGRTGSALDAVSARPDFAVLVYPVISFMDVPWTHAGSRRNLIGEPAPEALKALLSTERQVTARTPPTLLIHAADDRVVPPENSIGFFRALREAGVPAELHIFERGGHGFGMRKGHGTTDAWPARVEDWMRMHGWLPSLEAEAAAAEAGWIETVTGPVAASRLGMALAHEHVLVDFIGADRITPGRYEPEAVLAVAEPHVRAAAARGVAAIFECTPAFIGRDPQLLRALSERTGVRFVTNTGYYGAAGDKFVPAHARELSAEALAAIWIAEAREGIGDTGIRPGFIKIGVDPEAALSAIDRKLVEAAALAHRETGLTIAAHTGSGPGLAMLEILEAHGVAPEAFVWVHAQNAPDGAIFEAARRGAWISLDGLRPESLERHLAVLLMLREADLLGRVLLSHDAGWYDPGKPDGGTFRGYETLFVDFAPMLRSRGIDAAELMRILTANVARAFAVRRRLVR